MNYKLLIINIIVLILTACHNGRNYFPTAITPVDIPIVRFDEAIINVRAESVQEDVQYLYHEYDMFMPVFVQDILGIPVEDTAYLCQTLPEFLDDTLYGFRDTNIRVKTVFSDINDIHNEINDAFSRIHYLFPELVLPEIYFFVSGFNSSILFVGDDIAVGTDMYLGSDYEFYNRVVYDYQKYTMRKECLPADVVSAYLFRNLPYTGTKNRLLDNMIYRGKIMYLLSQVMPDEPKNEIMGYKPEQWQWCKRYERDVWNMIMDKRDLFKSESILLTGYLNDGPFTSEISQDAPARLGTWIGWRITESYMEHNQHISMQELIANDDAQNILENSFYKP